MTNNFFNPSIPEDFSSTNIENVCRVCLQTENTLSSIFEEEIDEMISEFLQEKVDPLDNFPRQICKKCIKEVKIAYKFKKQVEYSHEIIKKILDGKRLPRSLSRKSYNENIIPRIKNSPNVQHRDGTSLTCHICKRSLKRRDFLKKHLEKVHKFYKFEEYYKELCSNSKIKRTPNNKTFSNDNFIEEMPFPILPEVVMPKIEKNSCDTNNENLLENIFKTDNEKIAEISNSTKLNSNATKEEQQPSYDCHICDERLSTFNYLKCHLEKMHQLHDIDDLDVKPQMITLENTITIDSNEQIKPISILEGIKENDEQNNCDNDYKKEFLKCDMSKEIDKKSDLKEHELVNDTPNIDYVSNDQKKKSKEQNFIPVSNKTRMKTVNVYICHICEKEFSGRTTTRRHLKNIHKFENFADNIWLSKVYQKTIEAKIYECETCHKFFGKTQDLMRHQLLHSGHPRAKPYACTMCPKSFSRSNHLKTHVNGVHADLRPFKCLTCDKSFRRSEHLKRHILICTTERKRSRKVPTEHVFPCETCLRKFPTEKAVEDHVSLEHNETREFICKYCSEKIVGSTAYRQHCKEHYKTSKQFLCSECGGSFRKLQDFKIHLKRHTGEKPFKCRYCDKAFLRPADQHAHERCHTGERNFQCTNCPKAFSTAYKLRVHMRIHTGERPYKCQYCPRAFAKTGDLKIHHKRRHTSERFFCDLCDLGFVQMFNLRQHKRQLHGIDEPPLRSTFVNKVQITPENHALITNTFNENKSSDIVTNELLNIEIENNSIKNEIVCEVK